MRFKSIKGFIYVRFFAALSNELYKVLDLGLMLADNAMMHL
jgi:hypothetical protein